MFWSGDCVMGYWPKFPLNGGFIMWSEWKGEVYINQFRRCYIDLSQKWPNRNLWLSNLIQMGMNNLMPIAVMVSNSIIQHSLQELTRTTIITTITIIIIIIQHPISWRSLSEPPHPIPSIHQHETSPYLLLIVSHSYPPVYFTLPPNYPKKNTNNKSAIPHLNTMPQHHFF